MLWKPASVTGVWRPAVGCRRCPPRPLTQPPSRYESGCPCGPSGIRPASTLRGQQMISLIAYRTGYIVTHPCTLTVLKVLGLIGFSVLLVAMGIGL